MSLPNKGKILALDLGTRRTGVAVSDEAQTIAFPRDEIEHSSLEELLASLAAIISADEIVGILMGLPISMTGERTKQTEITQKMADSIVAEFQLPTQLIDERLTSQDARKHIARGAVDSVAAQFMLELHIHSVE
jgi:putative Holliday junction resolvase